MNIELELPECDLCGGFKNKSLYSMPDLRFREFEREYTVVECLDCGHRFLSPRPTIDSISHVYPSKYYANRDSFSQIQMTRYLKQTKFLSGIKAGRLLDVGCAGGAWLKVVQSLGWECYGTDFVKSDFMESGIDIRFGYLPDIDFKPTFFDAVSSWGAMEHVHEPSKYFKYINRILKDKGIFIFMVPNGDSLWSRLAYKEDIPRHLHFFRSKDLRQYADKYGFVIQNIKYTNDIYSIPATGRGLFKRRLLRMLNFSWEEVITSPNNNAFKILSKAASVLDHCLIHPRWEELLKLCGNMVVTFEKRATV